MAQLRIALLLIFSLTFLSCKPEQSYFQAQPGVTIAFFGDQGLGQDSMNVLKLVKSEGAQLVVHTGDLDYADNPRAWEAQINEVLGEDFPYVVSPGNHDAFRWFGDDGYKEKLIERLAKTPELECFGDMGVNSICVFKGIAIVLSGIGSLGKDHLQHLSEFLAQTQPFTWRICAWHKQQRAYQSGDKWSEVPWEAYDLCMQAGAFISQGHEHSYDRTYTMTDFRGFKFLNTSDDLQVAAGQKSFVFTSGLGGKSIRDSSRTACGLKRVPDSASGKCPYRGKEYTSTQGDAQYGALFCKFSMKSANHAECYFKNIRNKVVDNFTITVEKPESFISRALASLEDSQSWTTATQSLAAKVVPATEADIIPESDEKTEGHR